MSDAPILEARDLRKAYGSLVAVDGISLELRPGEIVGLLGPNGAGKTTTVSMLNGLLAPDRGEVWVGGRPLRGDTDPARRQLGLVPQDLALYDELSAHDNLRFFGALFGLGGAALEKAIAEALTFVGLLDRGRDRVKTFSGGMKRRLNLAAGLLHAPSVLLLDEPTVGVDPQSRNAIFDNLEELRRQGKALLYTTHYMEEAERLCDRIVIVDQGKVVAADTLRGLFRRLPAANRLHVDLDRPLTDSLDGLRSLPGVSGVAAKDSQLTVDLQDLAGGSAAVLAWLAAQGAAWSHVESERGNLETVFLHLTGKSLRDG